MEYLHDAQLANIVTSYCTCLAGIMPLLFTFMTKRQPGRWIFAYACIFVTGVPTVWLHSMEGNLVASFFDVGTNILLAWALIVAASGDFMPLARRFSLLRLITLLDAAVLGWLVYETISGNKHPLLRFGTFGQFYAGEVALIVNGWIVVGLFAWNYRTIPRETRPLFFTMITCFFTGMLMATASNDQITVRIIPWHALWHIVGAFGFITMWVFNHTRFNMISPNQAIEPVAAEPEVRLRGADA